MSKSTQSKNTATPPKSARPTASSDACVPPEEAVTEPMLLEVKTTVTESGPLPRLAVAPNQVQESLHPVSLEIQAEDATLIMPARRKTSKRRQKTPWNLFKWLAFGGFIIVVLMSVSIPTGFAIGHLLTEDTRPLPKPLQEHTPAETVTPLSTIEATVVSKDRTSLPVSDILPPFLNETTETNANPRPVEPDLDSVWAMVSRKPEQAKVGFEQHLLSMPDDPEGHYGLGYLYLKQGQHELSSRHLCRARDATDPETARDVRQLIKRNHLRCDED